MGPQRLCTCAVWVFQVEGEGAPMGDWSSSFRVLWIGMDNKIGTLRASHAFIDVIIHIDSKRVGENGTFMRVAVDSCCRCTGRICIDSRIWLFSSFRRLQGDSSMHQDNRHRAREVNHRRRSGQRLLCIFGLSCDGTIDRGPHEGGVSIGERESRSTEPDTQNN
jgi:hypothetical protein